MVSVSLPSRPRAVRVVGLDQATAADAAIAKASVTRPPSASRAESLGRLVRAQPSQALRVLEDWLDRGETHVGA
jgi:hypothetical protein